MDNITAVEIVKLINPDSDGFRLIDNRLYIYKSNKKFCIASNVEIYNIYSYEDLDPNILMIGGNQWYYSIDTINKVIIRKFELSNQVQLSTITDDIIQRFTQPRQKGAM